MARFRRSPSRDFAIAVAGMLTFGIFAVRHEGAYVPAHIENGKLVPGRLQ